ncbi:MAG: PfkB family carbohydrate kinase [Lachnospiraceae bacterium]|nr:PfkB family carbohydrate kinase [Lachnospiraceae bacterium]
MKPALIIGSTCVDVIINIDHLPTTEEDIHPASQTMSLGGCAFNVAYILHLMQAPHTFISPVGSGTYGDYVARQMSALGIPVSVTIPDKENGCCYCLVEKSGERTFMSLHGAEYTFQKEWMNPYPADHYDLVYVCGLEIEERTGVNLIEYLEEHPNLQVCYAPGPRGIRIEASKKERMFALHPVLHINEQEARELSGCDTYEAAAKALLSLTQNTVIITLGADGTYCLEADGTSYVVPGVPTTQVVDTIGAGDSHVGAILGCLTLGLSMREAIAYANRVASTVVGVKGALLPARMLPKLR